MIGGGVSESGFSFYVKLFASSLSFVMSNMFLKLLSIFFVSLQFVPIELLKSYSFISIWLCFSVAGIFAYYWCLIFLPVRCLNFDEILFKLPSLKLAVIWMLFSSLFMPYSIYNFVDGYWYFTRYVLIMTSSFYLLMMYLHYFPEADGGTSFRPKGFIKKKLDYIARRFSLAVENVKQFLFCGSIALNIPLISIILIIISISSINQAMSTNLEVMKLSLMKISYGQVYFWKINDKDVYCSFDLLSNPQGCLIKYSYLQEAYDRLINIVPFFLKNSVQIIGGMFFIFASLGYFFGNILCIIESVIFIFLCRMNYHGKGYRIIQISASPRPFALVSLLMVLSISLSFGTVSVLYDTLSVIDVIRHGLYAILQIYVTSGITLLILLKTKKFGYAIRKIK